MAGFRIRRGAGAGASSAPGPAHGTDRFVRRSLDLALARIARSALLSLVVACDPVLAPVGSLPEDDGPDDEGAAPGDGEPPHAYGELVRSEPGLLAYYPFDETSGSFFFDRVGGLHLIADPSTVRGLPGPLANAPRDTAILLPGAQGKHPRARIDARFMLHTQLSIELWVKVRGLWIEELEACVQPANPWPKLVWVGGLDGPEFGAYGLELNASDETSVAFHVQYDPDGSGARRAEKAITASSTLQSGTEEGDCDATAWHHVVATYDARKSSDNMILYVDGRIAAGDNPRSAPATTPEGGIAGYAADAHLTVGGVDVEDNPRNWHGGFDGYVDELAIYEVALTPAQVQTHFALGSRGDP